MFFIAQPYHKNNSSSLSLLEFTDFEAATSIKFCQGIYAIIKHLTLMVNH